MSLTTQHSISGCIERKKTHVTTFCVPYQAPDMEGLSAMSDVITKQLCCCLCQYSGRWSSGYDVNSEKLCRCLCQCPGQWSSGGFERRKFRLFLMAEIYSFYTIYIEIEALRVGLHQRVVSSVTDLKSDF